MTLLVNGKNLEEMTFAFVGQVANIKNVTILQKPSKIFFSHLKYFDNELSDYKLFNGFINSAELVSGIFTLLLTA